MEGGENLVPVSEAVCVARGEPAPKVAIDEVETQQCDSIVVSPCCRQCGRGSGDEGGIAKMRHGGPRVRSKKGVLAKDGKLEKDLSFRHR
jgi:hypothetical protein